MISRPQYRIRQAREPDQGAIRSLIRRVRINPLGLDWRNFFVAVNHQDEIIACGQIKTHRDRTRELASIAVEEGWRGRGIASDIIRTLLGTIEGPLWLVCRSELQSFYARFGFVSVRDMDAMPRAYRRMRSVGRFFARIIPAIGDFAIMLNDRTGERLGDRP